MAPRGQPADVDIQPGRAVVIAGDQRWDLIVLECLVGDEIEAPSRRLALSGSATEPFLESAVVLNVDILVSQVADLEEHRIAITRSDGQPDRGASDTPRPGSGGPAPDDWIEVDEDTGIVRGAWFQQPPLDIEPGSERAPDY